MSEANKTAEIVYWYKKAYKRVPSIKKGVCDGCHFRADKYKTCPRDKFVCSTFDPETDQVSEDDSIFIRADDPAALTRYIKQRMIGRADE